MWRIFLNSLRNLTHIAMIIQKKRKHILDTMIKDAGMRGKAKLIDGFIQKNVDEDKENFMNGRNRADGTNELEERFEPIYCVRTQ